MAKTIRTLRYAFVCALGAAVTTIALGVSVPATAGNGLDSPYVPAGYLKVFGDEFPQPTLNTKNWWTRYIYNNGTLDYLNGEWEVYREKNNHVILWDYTAWKPFLALQTYMFPQDGTDCGDAYHVCSGMLRSKKTFIGGYFESRIKLPPRLGGSWPAFWLNSATRSDGTLAWPPEVDILEQMFNQGTSVWHTGAACRGGANPQNCSIVAKTDPRCPIAVDPGDGLCHDANFATDYNTQYNVSADGCCQVALYKDWHIWGMKWVVSNYTTQAGYVVVYLDGKPIVAYNSNRVYDDGSPAGYAHVLLNLAMGDQGGGVDYGVGAESMFVDYVRVYQLPSHIVTGVDAVGVDLCPTDGSQC